MMKILIMGFAKIKFMPYMNFYLDNLNKDEDEIHVLYWNRDLKDEDLSRYEGCIFHELRCLQDDDVARVSKVKSFIKYRRHAKRLLKNENFDFIFVLHSLPGVLLSDVLKKKYRGRYIFDYRDSTYEGFAPYKRIIAAVTRNSAATFVSSDAFRVFLPEDCKEKIFTSLNFHPSSLDHRADATKGTTSQNRIRVSFWGFIRHEEINKEIIKKFAADDRFELHYYGREQDVAKNLKQYALSLSATNVFFHGEYAPDDRYEFIKSTDIIHNLYSLTEKPFMAHAMPNKYYDGVIFSIPQICTTGSFMAQKAERAGIGFSCDPFDSDFTEKVFEYYKSLDHARFSDLCRLELDRVLSEYNEGIKIIKKEVYG